jgi:hypothetical protein
MTPGTKVHIGTPGGFGMGTTFGTKSMISVLSLRHFIASSQVCVENRTSQHWGERIPPPRPVPLFLPPPAPHLTLRGTALPQPFPLPGNCSIFQQ